MPSPSPARLIQIVGRRIGDLRRAQGFTQAELAGAVDVSVKYLQRVEAGAENLTLRSLAGFAVALGVEVAELFVRPGSRRRKPGRPRARPADQSSSRKRTPRNPQSKPPAGSSKK
jgi:transcriptional regulator with XRE-family HTH domain